MRVLKLLNSRQQWLPFFTAVWFRLVVTLVIILLVFGLPLWLEPPTAVTDYALRLQAPSAAHWLGTDRLGHDILVVTLFGLRNSLGISLAAVSLACVLGTAVGVVAGYWRGWVDVLVGWCTDVLLAFPSILFAIALITVLGPGLLSTTIAVAIMQTPIFVRLSRSQVLSLREQPFIEAVQALGASPTRILGGHILPANLPTIIVQFTLAMGIAPLEASSLGFLGLSAQPPTPELGMMMADAFGEGHALSHPWTILSPGLMLTLMVLAFNLWGDWLQERLDPKH